MPSDASYARSAAALWSASEVMLPLADWAKEAMCPPTCVTVTAPGRGC
jgi:hypothetical protein